jgi:hypothetical protein
MVASVSFYQGFDFVKSKEIETEKITNALRSANLLSLTRSQYLKVDYLIDDQYVYLPQFKLINKGETKSFLPHLYHYNFVTSKSFSLGLSKTFSWQDVLKEASMGDLFFEKNYPTLHSFIWDVAFNNSAFKAKTGALEMKEFYRELKELIQVSFSLHLENALPFAQKYGPFFRSRLNFKEALSSLFEEPNQIKLYEYGEELFIIGKKNNKTHILPVERKPSGRLYSLEFNQKSNPKDLISVLSLLRFKEDPSSEIKKRYSVAESLDFFMNKSSFKKEQIMEFLFGHYFRVSTLALEKNETKLINETQVRIQETLNLLKNYRPGDETKKEDSIYLQIRVEDKLSQRLNEILNALKKKDLSYFGIKKLS